MKTTGETDAVDKPKRKRSGEKERTRRLLETATHGNPEAGRCVCGVCVGWWLCVVGFGGGVCWGGKKKRWGAKIGGGVL